MVPANCRRSDPAGGRHSARGARRRKFSWRNAQVAWLGGKAVGTVIDYDLDAAELPGSEVPEYLHPLCALELSAVGSRYINILAVLPEMRRQGVARALIEHVAARTDRDLTLIVRSGNAPALAFYESEGFDQEKAIPVGRGGPCDLTGRWCLMRRPSGSRVISENQNTVDRRRIPA
ncbi:GNAT family N-acetyltransferase [Sulfitobacter aestuariivivens]|uniref:GNAT family N-acetyltransferase n=1 Tax=Sulfitobacter aestuariivivens TaxID=2766981 RepID=UPI003608A14C